MSNPLVDSRTTRQVMDFIAGTSPLEEVANYYFFQGTATVSASGTSALAKPAGFFSGALGAQGSGTSALSLLGSISGLQTDLGSSTSNLLKPAGSFSGTVQDFVGTSSAALAKPAGTFSGLFVAYAGSGTSALSLLGSISGLQTDLGSGSSQLLLSGSFSGALVVSGSSSSALAFSGSAVGGLPNYGTSSSALALSGSAAGKWAAFLASSICSLWLPSPGGAGAVGASGSSTLALIMGNSIQAFHAQAPFYGNSSTYRSPYYELSTTGPDLTYLGALDSTSSLAPTGDYYLLPIENSISASAGQVAQLPSPLAPHNSSGTSDTNSSVITPTAMTKSFAPGNWLINVPLYGPDNTQHDGQWQVYVNIWASTSTNGGVGTRRLLTASGPAYSQPVWPDTTKPIAQIIWNAPEVDLSSEYLIFDFALKCVSSPISSEYVDCWPMTIFTTPTIVSGALSSAALLIGGSASGIKSTFSFLNLALPSGSALGLHGEGGFAISASLYFSGSLAGASGALGLVSPTALSVQASGQGGQGVVGSIASAALAKPSGSATGQLGTAGTGSSTLQAPSGSAAGLLGEAGTTARALLIPSGSAAGLLGEAGSSFLALVIGALASGQVGSAGSSSASLARPGSLAAGQAGEAGSSAAALALSGSFTAYTFAGTSAASLARPGGLATGLEGETGSSAAALALAGSVSGLRGAAGLLSGSLAAPGGSFAGLAAQVGGQTATALALNGSSQGASGSAGASSAGLALGGLMAGLAGEAGSSAAALAPAAGLASGNVAQFAGASTRALAMASSGQGLAGESGSSAIALAVGSSSQGAAGERGQGQSIVPLASGPFSGGHGVVGSLAAAAILVAAIGLGSRGATGTSSKQLVEAGSTTGVHSIGGISVQALLIPGGSSLGRITFVGRLSGALKVSGSGLGAFVSPLAIEASCLFAMPGDQSAPFVVPASLSTFVVPGEMAVFVIPAGDGTAETGGQS